MLQGTAVVRPQVMMLYLVTYDETGALVLRVLTSQPCCRCLHLVQFTFFGTGFQAGKLNVARNPLLLLA